MRDIASLSLAALLLASFAGCEPAEEEPEVRPVRPGRAPPAAEELTEEEMEKGIGPVDEVELGPVDRQLAAEGEQIFISLCASCHRLDERYVGPPLGDVLERRTPEYVMNMVLNPEEMIERHPVVRQLLAQYYVRMPNQGLSRDEARAVLEYLRVGEAQVGQGSTGAAEEQRTRTH